MIVSRFGEDAKAWYRPEGFPKPFGSAMWAVPPSRSVCGSQGEVLFLTFPQGSLSFFLLALDNRVNINEETP